MSFGWFLDGFASASAGFSVLDSFTIGAAGQVNKTYSTDVLRYATKIRVFASLASGSADYTLYDYPTLSTSLDSAGGHATVKGVGGGYPFRVLVFIQ